MRILTACLLATAAAVVVHPSAHAQTATAGAAVPTAAEADAFVAGVEKEGLDFLVHATRVAWINATYVTDDTDAVAAKVGAEYTERSVRYAKEAARFDKTPGLAFDTRRKLDLLKQQIGLPASARPGAADELSTIATRLASAYAKGKGTLDGQPIDGSDIEEKMATVREPARLEEMWTSWHDRVGRPMKADYARVIELANEGARELGYADTGAMWRSGYDMPAADFAPMVDRLWGQVKPLYDQLHCYTRTKLAEHYGPTVQKDAGPIRADLLGNMWAQHWDGLYEMVAPKGVGDIGYDLTALLNAKGYDAKRMVKTGEGFYSSLGFPPLPETFWERSMLVKPKDREVQCHASAWDVDQKDDIRIKMCMKINDTDFVTVHHELGHNYYQRAYKDQPLLYLSGANDGFHEAIGDFVALSITPDYLVQIGLLDAAAVPSPEKDIGLLLNKAMDKVAFLPFGLLIDKWRWGVFDGSIPPAEYEAAWNRLRLQYQGVAPPVVRGADAFDPGAKSHIADFTPYVRYFLAAMLQFQFYEAACRQAGWNGPLHRCSFYGNREVGQRFQRMLAMGQSRPWPEALETFTGTRRIDGSAMVRYFQPLQTWLEAQNKGRRCGW